MDVTICFTAFREWDAGIINEYLKINFIYLNAHKDYTHPKRGGVV